MENQHRQIAGYRELEQEEIDAMNEIKERASDVGELVERLAFTLLAGEPADPRWVAIACTHLQEGFMALTRAIAKPTTF